MTAADTITQAYPSSAEDRVRADFYALVARVFWAAPDADLLGLIAGAGPLQAEASEAALPRAWDAVRSAAARCATAAVEDEYAALFIAVAKPPVALYGSYYLTGFMNEKPLARLRDDLANLGLSRAAGVTEPEDHIAALADVMRHLALDESVAPDLREERQHAFFQRHIEPWYGRLFMALDVAEGADFYRCAGGLARAFLDLEKDSFQIEV